MNVELVPAKTTDKAVLRPLLELCMYDFIEWGGEDVDEQGFFGYGHLDHYWTESGRHSYPIRVEGKLRPAEPLTGSPVREA